MPAYLSRIQPMRPIKSGVVANFRAIEDIQAVLFDIYGTLLISAAGDINKTSVHSPAGPLFWLDALNLSSPADERQAAIQIRCRYLSEIQAAHVVGREQGIAHPEVDVLKIWRQVLDDADIHRIVRLKNKWTLRDLATLFEIAHNPVYPMPGLRCVINALGQRRILTGLVSNAQFYTLPLLGYWLHRQWGAAPGKWPFRPELTVLSYQQLRAKPDFKLFDLARKQLAALGISAHNTLFVGNDMLNDIAAAHQVGFRTALFAGDRRSLRWRSGDGRVAGVRPDGVITSLCQVCRLVV